MYVHGVIYVECQMLPRYDGLPPPHYKYVAIGMATMKVRDLRPNHPRRFIMINAGGFVIQLLAPRNLSKLKTTQYVQVYYVWNLTQIIHTLRYDKSYYIYKMEIAPHI